ncbi:MAG: hypothetical protein ACOX3U_00560 [Christensenellales bacterium]|jgi:D-alanine-D-alanine ligase
MNVIVLFGGKSCERDISIITALQAMGSMANHNILPVFIGDSGMYTGTAMQNINTYREIDTMKMNEVIIRYGKVYLIKNNKLKELFTPDTALICCHGGMGENGCLQGLLELNGIPYTSSGVLQSAVGMDKVIMKRLFNEMLLNTVPYATLTKEMICEDMTSCITVIESRINYPVIVKPCAQGSSIGIKIAKDKKELIEGLITASYYDKDIIVEEALTDMTEVNCAAVSDNGRIIVSAIEKPVGWNEFLTFEDKYILKGEKGSNSPQRELPAKINDTTAKCVKGLTERIYTGLGLSGVVRIDYMIDNKSGKIYVNEFNTVPGSLSYYLFEPLGIEFTELIGIMLNESIRIKKIKDNAVTYFPSRVLSDFKGKF